MSRKLANRSRRPFSYCVLSIGRHTFVHVQQRMQAMRFHAAWTGMPQADLVGASFVAPLLTAIEDLVCIISLIIWSARVAFVCVFENPGHGGVMCYPHG